MRGGVTAVIPQFPGDRPGNASGPRAGMRQSWWTMFVPGPPERVSLPGPP